LATRQVGILKFVGDLISLPWHAETDL